MKEKLVPLEMNVDITLLIVCADLPLEQLAVIKKKLQRS